MGATSARERAIADWMFGGGNPASWWLGLSTSTPADDGSGFSEPVGFAYTRVQILNDMTRWNAAVTASDGTTRKENKIAFTFPNPTGPWGNIVAWGLFLASSGGTPELHQLLDSSITPKNGNTPVEFAPGQIWIIVD